MYTQVEYCLERVPALVKAKPDRNGQRRALLSCWLTKEHPILRQRSGLGLLCALLFLLRGHLVSEFDLALTGLLH